MSTSGSAISRGPAGGYTICTSDDMTTFLPESRMRTRSFTASNGRRLIGYGGSQSMQTPSYFSPAVAQLLADVGIDPARFEEFYDQNWAEERGLSSAVFFDAAQWGEDRLVVRNTKTTAEWVNRTPLSDQAKADLVALLDAPGDYLPGMTPAERLDRSRGSPTPSS